MDVDTRLNGPFRGGGTEVSICPQALESASTLSVFYHHGGYMMYPPDAVRRAARRGAPAAARAAAGAPRPAGPRAARPPATHCRNCRRPQQNVILFGWL